MPMTARILAYLSGGTPERGNWHAQQAEIQSAVHRFRIPHELCELIMPLMCATGRVRYLNSDERSNTPLTWDDGPAWELSLRLVPDDAGADDAASPGKPTPLSYASESVSDEPTSEESDFEVDLPVSETEAVESGSEPEETPAVVDKGSWRIEGQLCRENEILPLSRTVLLVPGGLVLTAKRIARLRDFGAFAWVKLLERGERLRVPTGEEHDFIDQLLDMPALPRLDLPEELRLEEVTCDPVPHLTLRAPRGAMLHGDRLQGDVSFDYVGTQVRASSSQWAIVQRTLGRCIVRNKQREEQRWLQLVEQGFRRLLDPRRTGRDVEISARSLGPAVRSIAAEGWQVHADGKRVRQPTDLRFRVRSNVDWFELHAQVDFEGARFVCPISCPPSPAATPPCGWTTGRSASCPKNGSNASRSWRRLGTAEDDHVRYAMNTVTMLDALLASMPETDYDSQFLELRSRLGSPLRIQAIEEPRGFHGELRGYQKEGLGWLKFLQRPSLRRLPGRRHGSRKDDSVSGSDGRSRKARNKTVVPSLVVVPKSLLFNWHSECTPLCADTEGNRIQRNRTGRATP